MSCPLRNTYKYSSTTPKRVHFDDATTTRSRSSSNSSRLPQSPYPEVSKLGSSTPTPKIETRSPELSHIPRLRQNINYLYRNQNVPQYQEAQVPVTRAPPSPSPLSPDYSEVTGLIFGVMAQPYKNIGAGAGAGGAVNYQPQVPDTSNGPEGYYYVPRHDQGYMPALGFGSGCGAYPPAPLQHPFPSLQPLQPLQPLQQPVGFPLMGQPPVTMPLQQLVTPRPVIQQPVPQLAGQPMMFHPGMQALPQPLYLQQAIHQGHVVRGNGTMPVAMSLAAVGGGIPDPAFGIGLTSGEVAALNEEYAARSNVDAPQDFRPADPDPSRMYRVRELDGTWVLLSRATIERGAFRWYITDEGVFYAVRLPN